MICANPDKTELYGLAHNRLICPIGVGAMLGD